MKLINFISPGKLKLFLAECKKIFAPISHIHKTSDIENLDENLNNKYDKTAVQTQGTVLAAPSDKDGIADFRKLTKEDIGLGDVAQIVHLTKAEYKELEKKGQLNPDIDYATTDESDNITDSSIQLWNTSSSLAQQGKYLSYSDQNGGKYLSLMNSSDNTAVAHAKLMDGESGEGMDVDADKVKTIDSKGILVDALGETTAQALIDEVAKRVIDLTGRMSTTENGLQSANDAITSLNSEIGYIQNYDIDTLSSPSQLTHSGYYQFVNCSSTVNDNASTKFTDYQTGDFVGLLIARNGYATSDAGCQWGTFIITSPRFTNKFWIGRIWGYKFVNFIKIGS